MTTPTLRQIFKENATKITKQHIICYLKSQCHVVCHTVWLFVKL